MNECLLRSALRVCVLLTVCCDFGAKSSVLWSTTTTEAERATWTRCVCVMLCMQAGKKKHSEAGWRRRHSWAGCHELTCPPKDCVSFVYKHITEAATMPAGQGSRCWRGLSNNRHFQMAKYTFERKVLSRQGCEKFSANWNPYTSCLYINISIIYADVNVPIYWKM